MKKLAKYALRGLAGVSPIRSIAAKSFANTQRFFRTLENERYLQIYGRYRQFTRIPQESYVANLEVVEREVRVPGSVVECGVWRGGMCAGMADILGPGRSYYLFDSFEGLPDAQSIDGQTAVEWQTKNSVDNCRTEPQYAEQAMESSAAHQYRVIKGWFNESLADFHPDAPIAVLRLDADWYSSTAECLNYLYPLVPKGGLVILDDYFSWDGCSRAVHDFFSKNALCERIISVDRMLAYFVKIEERPIQPIDPGRVFV